MNTVTMKLMGVVLGDSEELHSVCLSAEKNSVRGKAIGKKWFVRIGCS